MKDLLTRRGAPGGTRPMVQVSQTRFSIKSSEPRRPPPPKKATPLSSLNKRNCNKTHVCIRSNKTVVFLVHKHRFFSGLIFKY